MSNHNVIHQKLILYCVSYTLIKQKFFHKNILMCWIYFANFTKNKIEILRILNSKFYFNSGCFFLMTSVMSLFFSFNLLKQNLYYLFPISIIFLIISFSLYFLSVLWKCSAFVLYITTVFCLRPSPLYSIIF